LQRHAYAWPVRVVAVKMNAVVAAVVIVSIGMIMAMLLMMIRTLTSSRPRNVSHPPPALLLAGTHALFAFTTNVPPIALMCCIGIAYVKHLSHPQKL
jgi:hypothetical protein